MTITINEYSWTILSCSYISYFRVVEYNANIKLLMGGHYRGGCEWNKPASEIDHCYKLYYMVSGMAELRTESCSYFLEAGNVYFINGYILGEQRCMEDLDIHWLHFQPQSVYLNHLLKQAPCALKLDNKEMDSVRVLLEKTGYYFGAAGSDFAKDNPPGAKDPMQLELIALVHLSIASVFRKMENILVEEEKGLTRLMPALDLITRSFRENISLKELADACCLSPNYFHRLFSSSFGMSPLYYIRMVRLEEAIRQLVYTRKPVKEVAWDTGFEDESYFSRTFTKSYGVSPGRYRKVNSRQGP